MESIELSIIIVNYHCAKMINDLIYNFIGEEWIEIIIIDNSNDFTSQYRKIKVLSLGYNAGFARACNLGIKNSTTHYVLLLNPDCKVNTLTIKNALSEYVELQKKSKNIGLYTIKCLNGNGQFCPTTVQNIPSLLQTITNKNKLLSFIKVKNNELMSLPKTALVHGSFMLFNKTIDNKYFDEDFFMYGEDSEFSIRMLKKGLNNYFSTNHSYIHFEGGTYSSNTLRNKQSALSLWLFNRKAKGVWYVTLCYFFLMINLIYFSVLKLKNICNEDKKNILTKEIDIIRTLLRHYFNITYLLFKYTNKHSYLKHK